MIIWRKGCPAGLLKANEHTSRSYKSYTFKRFNSFNPSKRLKIFSRAEDVLRLLFRAESEKSFFVDACNARSLAEFIVSMIEGLEMTNMQLRVSPPLWPEDARQLERFEHTERFETT